MICTAEQKKLAEHSMQKQTSLCVCANRRTDDGVQARHAAVRIAYLMLLELTGALLRCGVEDAQCCSKAGTQGHGTLVWHQKAPPERVCWSESLTALLRLAVHCSGLGLTPWHCTHHCWSL